MGALDDAIREHLELKRRHGASEEEIQQAEAEALGPARREPGAEAFVDEAGMSVPPPPPPPAAPFDDDHFDQPLHEVVDEPPPLASDAVEDAPPPPPPESVPLDPTALRALPGDLPSVAPIDPEPAEPTQVEPAEVEPAPAHEAPVDESPVEEAPVEAPDPGTPKPHGDPALDDDDFAPPPIHHEPDPDEPPAPARPPGAEAHDEDVLEETPEFLQDTPDHDRLWFEQKPPRDFDLDD
jgi:hypothetical protein